MIKKIFYSILSFALLFIIWKLGISINLIDPVFYPDPFKIMQNTAHLITTKEFNLHVFHSLYRLSLGLALSFVSAYFIVFLCFKFSILDQLLSPIVAALYPIPKVAIFPLLLIIFGIDDKSKIAMITLGTFFLFFINLKSGLDRIKNSPFNQVIQIYKIKGFNLYFQIYLKGTFREQIIGFMSAFNYGLTLMVVSEFSLAKNGIGYFIWSSWDQFRIIDLYSALFVLAFIGVFFYQFLNYLLQRQTKKIGL